ncbi:UDP-N-acetylglucosamine 2-epimerase [Tissierella sp.]|uniref:UDP-N-acetylglucosamine 2-epimerase n=1 Tax=Tissierella sp. TaxID=41274 RepID=UPI0028588207|nr:UDP-N-acetylglucosamine 2-epimerase [Tissierella sp.]MDR7857539.1 UDP-N-acetylglucosamine 2-epimerase [Tissierella sp.]
MKKVCLITGTRAEYGLLRPLIKRIKEDDELQLQIIATGMHLSPEFGLTYKEIEEDGFMIDEKVEILLSSDTSVGISKSMGLAMIGFADAFQRLKPDMVVVLGDRYEMLSVASVAMISRIPIAHIHGGETGAGTVDNMVRHAITKMSFLHFTSTETYRRRVIQLGEYPSNVYNVGSLGIENIKELRLLSKDELEDNLNFHINDKTILFTFHPLSLESHFAQEHFSEILKAFDRIEDLRIIFTKCNSDTGGRIINEMIDEYVSNNSQRSISFFSLGVVRYLSAVKYVKAVVGNSSSGIIEVPSLKTYTLNIGKRQDGRIQSGSIINCNPTEEDIFNKLTDIMERPRIIGINNPYEKENTSMNIFNIIKQRVLEDSFSEKDFYDLEC